ncbi:hypothetical protein PENSPDRAFT_618662 [Peniophora sp. CONT]|nr:hypothetical protein PENSPDRAFT_618662 [Peniophora sp. CONT]
MPVFAVNPYAPDEPESLIIKERGVLSGIGLGLAAWGILFTLAVQCVSALLPRARRETGKATLLVYVVVMFALGTVAIFLHLHWVQEFLIDNRNFPGGPLVYDATFYANPINITGVVCYFIMNWMADGLLLYRLYVIYGQQFLYVAFPLLMFLTSFSLSVVDLYTLAQPGNSMFTDSAVNIGLLYWSFSIALNVIVTSAIVGRLLVMRARLASVNGPRHAQLYVSISAMLIESASLYSVTAIIFLIGYSMQNALQFAAEPVEILQGVAPLMIILRVARGTAISDITVGTGMGTRGGTASTGPQLTSMQFTPSASRGTTTRTSTRFTDEADLESRAVHWPDIYDGSLSQTSGLEMSAYSPTDAKVKAALR